MTTERLVWIDDRYGMKGRAIMILPITILGLPFVLAIFGYALLYESFTGAEPVFWILVFCFICVSAMLIGTIKYFLLLRIAPQRVLYSHNMFELYFFFGGKKSVPINTILSAELITHGALTSIYSPAGSRQPTLVIGLKDGKEYWLNGDYSKDSELVSLLNEAEIAVLYEVAQP